MFIPYAALNLATGHSYNIMFNIGLYTYSTNSFFVFSHYEYLPQMVSS